MALRREFMEKFLPGYNQYDGMILMLKGEPLKARLVKHEGRQAYLILNRETYDDRFGCFRVFSNMEVHLYTRDGVVEMAKEMGLPYEILDSDGKVIECQKKKIEKMKLETGHTKNQQAST